MQAKCYLLLLVLAAAGAASCSEDPDVAKRQYLASGDRFLEKKQYPEAIVQYRNALRFDPKFGDARLRLTDAYIAVGDVRNAIGESVRAADVMPESVDAQLRAGTLLLLAKQYPEAKERALAALTKDPKNSRGLILLGNALAGLKDIDGAIELAEHAIDSDPQFTLSYTNLADLYSTKGDQKTAEAAFRRAVTVAPKSVDAHLSLANFLWARGRFAEAEKELKAAHDIEPRSVVANRALATFYVTQNRGSEAESYFKTYTEVMATVEARLLLADYYVINKNIPAATPILTEVAKSPRGVSPATMRLAMLDFREGRRTEAYRRLEDVLGKQPKDEDALQTKVRFLLLEQKNQEALSVADSLIAVNAQSPTGQYLRGLALQGIGSIPEATAVYQELLKSNPALVPAQARLATLLLGQGNAKDALGYAEQVLRAEPQSPAAHYLYSQALLRSGDLQRAEQDLLALLKVAPSSPDVHTSLGMLYEAKRDTQRARQSYQKAFDLQPGAIGALAGLISVDITEKKPAAAVARIESQLAQRPKDVTLLSMHAMTLMTVGDLSRAEAAYRKVLDAAPANMEAYSRLGAIYLAQNRLDEARKSYEDRAQRQPSVVVETILGMILTRQNKSADARAHFERALKIDPHAAVAANNLAWDYANNGENLDLALQLAQTAKAAVPDNASISDTLGWVYYKKGLSSLAVSSLRQATAQNPSSPGTHYRLGLALIQQGNKTEGRRALEQALRLKPDFPSADDARRALASITSSS